MNDDQLIAAARDYEDDPDVPLRLSEIALELARRLEAALAREEEVTHTSIAQQNAGAALVRAYQARVEQQRSLIESARYLIRAIKADRPTAHSEAVWAEINEFLDTTEKEYGR